MYYNSAHITYIVVIDCHDLPSGRLYGAFVPDVPGCTATGKSIEQVVRQIHDVLCRLAAASLHQGCALPEAHSLEEHERYYASTGEPLLGANSIITTADVPCFVAPLPHYAQ